MDNTVKAAIHVGVRAPFRRLGLTRLVRAATRAALACSDLDMPVELTIRLTDDAELQRLNRQFRGKDEPTDVLSFGGEAFVDGEWRSPLSPLPSSSDPFYLGDLAISMQRAQAQAEAHGHNFEQELALLVIHGVLHLLGYDHTTPARKKRMWQAQDRAFAQLGMTNPLR